MRKILVVDDIALNRAILEDILEEEYDVVSVSGGADAISTLGAEPEAYGLVLLDLVMPDVSGFDVLEQMNEWNLLDSLPVIVISAEESNEVENRTLNLHAVDYIRKPFDEQVVRRRVRNVFELYSYKRGLESRVAAQTEILRDRNKKLQEQAERIKLFNDNITDLLGTVVEYRDSGSGEHVQRVKVYTELLAHEAKARYPELGLTDARIERIARASVLHDLGKIAIPDGIMLKPGRLTEEEYEVMKNHTIRGGEILEQVGGAWEEDFGEIAYEICRYHHERYDGRGYPDGLAGDDIPLSAQLVSIADVYDALVTDRPYKKAFTPDVAYRMITNNECGVFSPQMLECFEAAKDKFAEVALGAKLASGGLEAQLEAARRDL